MTAPTRANLHSREPAAPDVCEPLVSPMRPSDSRSCMRVLARAFRDNPLNVAVIRGGPRARLRANTYGARSTIRGAMAGNTLVLVGRPRTDADVAGLLVGASPLGYPGSAAPLGVQLRCLVGQGWRTVRRWGQVYRILDRCHPLEPHWYLDVLGVHPDFQGRGLGAALVEAFVARVDEDQMPSYLETDAELNVRFYGRWGYRVTRETEVLGVKVWCMWRDAAAAPATDAVGP